MALRASEMGWTESQFWRSSFSEYIWAWNGYYRKIERSSLEGARMIYGIIYNANSEKKNQVKDFRKLIQLSIDPKQVVKDQAYWKKLKDSIPDSWYKILEERKKDN